MNYSTLMALHLENSLVELKNDRHPILTVDQNSMFKKDEEISRLVIDANRGLTFILDGTDTRY